VTAPNTTPKKTTSTASRENGASAEPTPVALPIDLASLSDEHSLRHYFVSELMRGGASAEAARVLAGHATLEMIQRYAHVVTADLRAGHRPARALGNWEATSAPSFALWPVFSANLGWFVGVAGFEPATAGTQSRPSTRLRYTPVRSVYGSRFSFAQSS
jgi:hypothetical protein